MDEPTPHQILQEFQFIRKSYQDTLGEFLTHYHKIYFDVSDHGVVGVEGILHLIPLLPAEWRRWAASLIPQFVDRVYLHGHLYGDCGGFIAALSHRYLSNGTPPPGPHEIPHGYEALGILIEYEPPLNPVPFVFEPDEPAPMVPAPEPEPEPAFEQNPELEPIFELSSETLSTLFSKQEDTDSYIAPFNTPTENSTLPYLRFETLTEVVSGIPMSSLTPEPPIEPISYSPDVQRAHSVLDPSQPEFHRHIPVPKEFKVGCSRRTREDSGNDKEDEEPVKELTADRGKVRCISPNSLSFPVAVSQPEYLARSPSDKAADDEMENEDEGIANGGADEGMNPEGMIDDEEEPLENEKKEHNGDDEEEDPSEGDSE